MAFEILIPISLFLLFVIVVLFIFLSHSQKKLAQITFDKHSQSTRYGKLSEQFMPFLKDYPYDPQRFRFIGSPIDGVQFGDDKIVFIEFKAGDSRLTERQKKIKALVENKSVEFEEITIS